MAHIYTKTGDTGETGLLGGVRISKSSTRISAIGNVDELNAYIGILRNFRQLGSHKKLLEQIQRDLFSVGAQLADSGPIPSAKSMPTITEYHIKNLEHTINALGKKLPALRNFILPAGTPYAAHAHFARAICRRAECSLVALHKKEPQNKNLLIYLNRLSDLLFMLARNDLFEHKGRESTWKSM